MSLTVAAAAGCLVAWLALRRQLRWALLQPLHEALVDCDTGLLLLAQGPRAMVAFARDRMIMVEPVPFPLRHWHLLSRVDTAFLTIDRARQVIEPVALNCRSRFETSPGPV